MTTEEKLLLEGVNNKLDLLLACFGLDGKPRATPREIEAWAKETGDRYRKRKGLNSSPGMGKVLPLTGKEIGKDECEKSQGT